MSHYISDHDAILAAVDCYIAGCRTGQSAAMRPGFHPKATVYGHTPGGPIADPIETLYGWVDGNGPSPGLEARVASVEISDYVAVVRLELRKFTGQLTGGTAEFSDFFTLLKSGDRWLIVQKLFNWHGARAERPAAEKSAQAG
jgi:hypothetical protein